MTSFEWFLLIVVVVVVPLIVAVVVTLWTIDQANKRKRSNRNDPRIGVKRKAALSPEEVAARKAARTQDIGATSGDATAHNQEETHKALPKSDSPKTSATPSAVGASGTGSDSGSSDGGGSSE